jgi:hypothetical protein
VSSAAVFQALMREDAPVAYKRKKISVDAFEALFGGISARVRYDSLSITSDVTVAWTPDTGAFAFSGNYGLYQGE